MSVTFIISDDRANHDADSCPACVESGRWQECAACEGTGFSEARRNGHHTPPNYVNVANVHAVEILRWLGYEVDPSDLMGVLTPADLRARCYRRLTPSEANRASDPARSAVSGSRSNGCRFHIPAREAGYLARVTRELLALAERAGDRLITFE